MKYDIVHDLPGRMRVHCRALRRDPGCRVELERWISAHSGLLAARLSTRTGNLLIHYSRSIGRQSLLVMLDDLQLFGVARLTEPDGRGRLDFTGALTHACRREALSLVRKAVLPQPARMCIAGWKLVHRLADLFGALLRGDLAAFFLGAARLASVAFFGKTAVARIVLYMAWSVLGQPRLPDASMAEVEAVEVECQEEVIAMLPVPERISAGKRSFA